VRLVPGAEDGEYFALDVKRPDDEHPPTPAESKRGAEGPPPAPEYIAGLAEFVEQMGALTLGALGDLLAGPRGPFVVAGGAVLACLRRWDPAGVPVASLASWPDALPELATRFAAEVFGQKGINQHLMAAAAARFQMQQNPPAPPPGSREALLEERIVELERRLMGAAWAPPPAPEPPRMEPAAARYLGLVSAMSGCQIESAGPGGFAWVNPWNTKSPEDDSLHAFRGTDIDLFLVTRDPDEALRAIRALHARLVAAVEAALPREDGEGELGEIPHGRYQRHAPVPPRVTVMRTAQAITFFMPKPFRTVQVILRLYHSLEHVLLGFDVDACCFGFDGRRVLALPRALRAVRRGYNLVDPSRQSLTYEARLLKYARRGFAVGIPADVNFARILARVRRGIDAAVALSASATPALTGLELLVGMFAAVGARDAGLMRRLGVRRSDYSSDQSAESAESRVRACHNDPAASVPFALGDDLDEVLFGQKAVAPRAHPSRPWKPVCIARALVPPALAFQVSAPHRQDRVDAPHLFTGAFHPSTAAWSGEEPQREI